MSKTVDETRFESVRSLGYVNRGSNMRETLLHILLFLNLERGWYHVEISKRLGAYR